MLRLQSYEFVLFRQAKDWSLRAVEGLPSSPSLWIRRHPSTEPLLAACNPFLHSCLPYLIEAPEVRQGGCSAMKKGALFALPCGGKLIFLQLYKGGIVDIPLIWKLIHYLWIINACSANRFLRLLGKYSG